LSALRNTGFLANFFSLLSDSYFIINLEGES
jgi:hypothetical protein